MIDVNLTERRTQADSERYVRFSRARSVPEWRRAELSPEQGVELIAALAHSSPARVLELERDFESMTEQRATVLLQNAQVRAYIERIPFAHGARVVALGDSITADRVGWAEQLRHLLRLAGKGDVQLTNLGLSGSTSTDTIERLDLVSAERPDWILLAIGTNDPRRQTLLPTERLVSGKETTRNLRRLREAFESLGVRVIPFTPSPVDETFGRATLSMAGGLGSMAADIADVSERVRDVFGDVIDLQSDSLLDPLDRSLMDEDGVHPTIDGHSVLLRCVLAGLSKWPRG